MHYREIALIAAVAALACAAIPKTAHAIPSQCDAASGNLVQDCGFEQAIPQSFVAPGWTFTPASAGADFNYDGGIGLGPHSGGLSANFGATQFEDDEISQAVATIAGHQYSISFWLGVAGGETANHFKVTFGSDTLFDETNFGTDRSYESFSFVETATSSSTGLAFFGFNPPSWTDLDDIVVLDLSTNVVPEPASITVLGAGLLGFAALRRGKVQERRHLKLCRHSRASGNAERPDA